MNCKNLFSIYPVSTITTYHNTSVFKQQEITLLWFWRSEVKVSKGFFPSRISLPFLILKNFVPLQSQRSSFWPLSILLPSSSSKVLHNYTSHWKKSSISNLTSSFTINPAKPPLSFKYYAFLRGSLFSPVQLVSTLCHFHAIVWNFPGE